MYPSGGGGPSAFCKSSMFGSPVVRSVSDRHVSEALAESFFKSKSFSAGQRRGEHYNIKKTEALHSRCVQQYDRRPRVTHGSQGTPQTPPCPLPRRSGRGAACAAQPRRCPPPAALLRHQTQQPLLKRRCWTTRRPRRRRQNSRPTTAIAAWRRGLTTQARGTHG